MSSRRPTPRRLRPSSTTGRGN